MKLAAELVMLHERAYVLTLFSAADILKSGPGCNDETGGNSKTSGGLP
jgi:hypothetical protein